MEKYYAQQISAGPQSIGITGSSPILDDNDLDLLEEKIKKHSPQIHPWLIYMEPPTGNKIKIIKYVDINTDKWIEL